MRTTSKSAAAVMSIVLLSAIAVSAADTPLRPSGIIPLPGVEGRIDHFTVDVDGARVFLSALGNNTVEVVDVRAGNVVRELKGLKNPQGCCYLPGLNLLAVADKGDGVCRVFDAGSYHPLRSIDLRANADNVRRDPRTRRIWIGYGQLGQTQGGLALINPVTGNVLRTIALPGHPESFQLETSGPRIFVNLPPAHEAIVVDRVSRKTTAIWPIGVGANYPMALDETSGRVLIVGRSPPTLLAFDAQSGRLAGSCPCAGDADDIWFDPATHRIYISGGEGRVSVIEESAGAYRQVAAIPTAPGARTSLFVPQWRKLFVAVPHRGDQPAELRVFTATEGR